MNRALIISGFPGVGKTSLERYERIVDLESSGFHWNWVPGNPFRKDRLAPPEPRLNPLWPKNYIDKIDELSKEDYQKIILVSTHPEVLAGLEERRIPFLIVLPTKDLKNEYMIRYLRRGSGWAFLKTMDVRFDEFIDNLEKNHAPKIYLARGQYLQDVLPPL